MNKSIKQFYSLKSLLRKMVYTRKEKPLAYSQYSRLLISKYKSETIDYTMRAVIGCFLSDPLPEEDLIFKNGNDVSLFFKNLCNEFSWIVELELCHNNSYNRYRIALIFRSLFSLKKSLPTFNLCKELLTEKMIDIWHQFLNLFTDSEPKIRVICVQTIEVILMTQMDELIVNTMVSNLNKRLRDVNETIRIGAQFVVSNCHDLDTILDHNLMRHFVARIGDKELEVRKEALICVSNVFQTIQTKYNKTRDNFIYKLPTACLLRYGITDIEEEKSYIELVFTINLIGNNIESEAKMKNLLNLICFCDDSAIKNISQLFHSQLKIRTYFAKLIVSTERHDFNVSLIDANNKVYQNLVKCFQYIDGIEELLKNFHNLLKNYEQQQDFDDLLDVFTCNPSINCEQSVNIMNKMIEINLNSVNEETLISLKEEITHRTGIGLINGNNLIQLFKLMDKIDVKFVSRLTSFIVLLTKCYSNYFNDNIIKDVFLSLPPILIKYLSNEDVLCHMNCGNNLKEMIKDMILWEYI